MKIVIYYVFIIPLSLTTILFLPYFVGDFFGNNFKHVKIHFLFQIIHIPFFVFLILRFFSQFLSSLFFYFIIIFSVIFSFFEIAINEIFGLNISVFIFNLINFENASIAVKSKFYEILSVSFLIILIFIFLNHLLDHLKTLKISKIALILIMLFCVRGIYILHGEWYRAHEQVSLISFAKTLNKYQQKKKDVNVIFSQDEISIINKNNIFLGEPSILKLNNINNLNIIHLIIESFQRNFTNIDNIRIKTYTPEIDHFLLNNYSPVVYNILGPTLNSVIGMECGLWPELSNRDLIDDNSYGYKKICLGDILDNFGYIQYYITGSNPNFANKKSFYKHHGFKYFIGKHEIFNSHPEFYEKRHLWGVQDNNLISFLIDWFESKERNKFRVLISTTNGHEPGYLDPNCPVINKSENQYTSIIRCTDYTFGRFWKWFIQSSYSKNTILIISGDHPVYLPRSHEISDLLLGGHGQMLFGIYYPQKNNEINFNNGHLNDISPTILELLNLEVVTFRSGNSLMSNKKQNTKTFSSQMKLLNGHVIPVKHCPNQNLQSWTIKQENFTHECSIEKIRRGLDKY